MLQTFPALARPELQSSVELKCWLGWPVLQEKKAQKPGKTPALCPSKDFSAARKKYTAVSKLWAQIDFAGLLEVKYWIPNNIVRNN